MTIAGEIIVVAIVEKGTKDLIVNTKTPPNMEAFLFNMPKNYESQKIIVFSSMKEFSFIRK